MDPSRILYAAAIVGGSFYAGYRFAGYITERRNILAYEEGVSMLKYDLSEMKKSFEKATSDVRKAVKSRYDSIIARAENELHRSELIDGLRHEVLSIRNALS